MAKVDIIMPVYNVEPYLDDSIHSVQSQTFTSFNLICIDDGSPDQCASICDACATQNKNMIVLHKRNNGRSATRNAGIALSSSEYLLFIDSDDTLDHTALETLVPIAETKQADVLIFGMRTYVIKNEKITSIKDVPHKCAFYANRQQVEAHFVNMCEHSQWNHIYDKLYRRQVICENHVQYSLHFDPVGEDAVFLLDLFPYLNSVYIHEGSYYNYMIRDIQSVVMRFIPDRYQKSYGKFLLIKTIVENMPASVENERFLQDVYLQHLLWAYESLFHENCPYSLFQRLRFILDTFQVDMMTEDFKNKALKRLSVWQDIGRLNKMAVQFIIRGRYLRAFIIHAITLLRLGRK